MNRFRGAQFQKGYGLGGFAGRNHKGAGLGHLGSIQNGYGLGGMWSRFAKWVTPLLTRVKNYAMPLLKSGSKIIGKEVVSAASDIANDVLEGKDLKSTASTRVKTGLDNLIGPDTESEMTGQGPINRKKRRVYGSFNNRKKKQRLVQDIFG